MYIVKPQELPLLLQSIRDSGAEPALAFNVGSSVTDPEAYRYSMSVTRSVLEQLPFRLRLIDVGGDYLEFGNIGAYSLSGRTDYNGFYSDRIVTITSLAERPPSL